MFRPNICTFALTIAVSVFSVVAYSDVSQLERLKNSLPEKALTLDLVVAKAMQSSDSFKAVKADSYRINAPLLQAEALHDTKVSVSQTWLKDKTEASNNFSPNRTESRATTVGLSRYTSTGTALELTASQGYTDIRFPSITVPDFYETQAKVSVSQNLWADSFGFAARRGLKAGKLATESRKYGFQSSVEGWMQNIINTFYMAWLSQAETVAAEEALKRRERLLNSVKVQLKRGTTETPDYLQVESAFLAAKTKKAATAVALDDQWRRLVILLKLPSDWSLISGTDIPLKIDNIELEAKSICQNFRKTGVPSVEPSTIKSAELAMQSATHNLARAKNLAAPDLKLIGTYFLNGVDNDDNISRRASENEAFDQDHPGWSVGLVLTMPLGLNAQKADAANAFAEKIRAEANRSTIKDENDLNWLNECTNLERLFVAIDDVKKSFQNQVRRANLEENRFRLGRTTTFNVIQAGDDATQAQILMLSTEVELRQAAWKILALDARMISKLQSFAKAHGGQFQLE